MINYAIRYQPILLELRERRPSLVLDVGSGPDGLGLFWRQKVVGTDLAFKRRALRHGVVACSLALPFANKSFPVVISCDMLEHIRPNQRQAAVREMARVASQALLLSFPSGEAAMRIYHELAKELDSATPRWLQEHLDYGLPIAAEVETWLHEAGWLVSTTWYESAKAHKKLVNWEQRLPVIIITYSLMRLVGPWLAPRLPISSDPCKLRVFIKAEPLRAS